MTDMDSESGNQGRVKRATAFFQQQRCMGAPGVPPPKSMRNAAQFSTDDPYYDSVPREEDDGDGGDDDEEEECNIGSQFQLVRVLIFYLLYSEL